MPHDTATTSDAVPPGAFSETPLGPPPWPSKVPATLDLPEFIGAGLVEHFAPLSAARKDGHLPGLLTAVEAAGAFVRALAEVLRRCTRCRGYGWWSVPSVREPPPSPPDLITVCHCVAGQTFWTLALTHTDCVLGLMSLSPEGRVTSPEGMFGQFTVIGREVRAWKTYRLAGELQAVPR